MGGCLPLTILGGAFEVAGLALFAWEITRLQRQEFGPPVFWRRMVAWYYRVVRRGKSTTVQVGSATVSAGGSMRVRATVTPGPAVLLEDKVRRLEQVTEFLQSELQESRRDFEQGLSGMEQRISNIEAERSRERQEEEQTRKVTIRRHITIQAVGTVLFFFGVVLSVLGNAVSC